MNFVRGKLRFKTNKDSSVNSIERTSNKPSKHKYSCSISSKTKKIRKKKKDSKYVYTSKTKS